MMIKRPGSVFLPNPGLQGQSETLSQLIRSEIQQHKINSISFARFMELALYEPRMGYYTAASHKFGKKGDFVTAPEISSLFAQSLGRQCQQVFADLGGGEILEVGAGTGQMVKDILLFLEQKIALPARYKILEISANLRQRQRAMLKEHIPHLLHLIEWLDAWPIAPIKGVVLANELVDAFPIHRFLWTQKRIQEMRVTCDKNSFDWYLAPLESAVLVEQLHQLKSHYFDHVAHYASEVCLGLVDWMDKFSAVIGQGLALIIDYGYPEREYYHFERCQGTLMCYHQHRAHVDPFTLIGLQDITASVNFSWLARCATEAGLTVAGFTSQAAFLINNGLLQHVEECYNRAPSIDMNRQVHRLTSPNEMGELIKVIGLTRGYESAVQGFAQYDRRARL
jgi:SAM-dependent MidA family methyltransferase